MLPQSPGSRLRDARRNLGYSQHDVAQRVFCSLHTYRKWERGEREPGSLSVVARLCDALMISADWYIRGREHDLVQKIHRLPLRQQTAIQQLLDRHDFQ